MSSPPGKIAVVQVSSGASCNASLPSTRRSKRLVNRDENRDFCLFPDARSRAPVFLDLARLKRTSLPGVRQVYNRGLRGFSGHKSRTYQAKTRDRELLNQSVVYHFESN